MTTTWDPAQYGRFADERGRPFRELVARIPTADPVAVVDLGCGSGTMTATLAERWPHAAILGIDSSPEMVESARAYASAQLSFRQGDIGGWRPAERSVDVIVSNAALQWVPGHLELLPVWARALDDGGTLAFQVPLASRAGEVITQTAAEGVWAEALTAVRDGSGPRAASPVRPAETYIDVLAGAGLRVDAWATTFYHVLPGEDPVLEWFAGTGLRPFLQALDGDVREAFRQEVAARFREEFPSRDYGTVLAFPRLFVVATAA